MTRLLRHSGATISRISRSSLLFSGRSAQLSPTVASRTRLIRSYATKPEEPKDSVGKKVAGEKDSDKKLKAASSKGASGTESKPRAESSAVPPPSTSTNDGEADQVAELRNGFVRLTEEEEQVLEKGLETLKYGRPEAQQRLIQQTFEEFKKHGIPPEMRDVMDHFRSGERMSLATIGKLTKTFLKTANIAKEIAKKEADEEVEELKSSSGEKKKDFEFKSNDQKIDPKNTFQSSKSQQKEKKEKKANEQSGSGTGWNGEWKLDTNTLLISGLLGWLSYSAIFPGEDSRDITWQEFKTTFLDKGLVEKLTVIGGRKVRVDLHRESTAAMYPDSPGSNPNFHYYFSIGSVEAFEKRLDEAQDALDIPSSEQIPLGYLPDSNGLASLFLSFGPTLLFLGAIFYMSRRSAGGGGANGVFGMGKSRAKMFNHEKDIKVKFKDVAGMDEAKVEIMEFVSFLKTPEQYERLGAKIPRGAILSGPPGTGKTLLAKATAGESNVPFFSVSGSEFVEMFVGVGASRVRDLFAMARKNTPCIIFIDEIDAIGKSRSKNGNFNGGNDEREATLNQILTEMDGFNTTEQVVVLAGTNRPDVLDQALMRPGRFDRHITIDRPTMEGRKQIFDVYLGKVVTHEDMDYLSGRLSALTPGFSGADIANCVNEAALIAARTSATSVAMKHFEQAIERVIGGLEKKSLVLKPEEKKTVAYHEAGHAICGWYFKYADPLLKVSIIPRGQGALGYAQYLPAGDTYLMNVNQLMDRMAMTLGGRVSEELHFETVTSGASDDFSKVTRLASAMVTQWGMSSKIGPLHYEDNENKLHKPFAESTAQTIDSEVRRIVDEAYKQCRDLLTSKKKEIGLVAEELLAKEVLTREDMVRLLGKRPFGDNEEFSKYFGGPGQGFGGGVMGGGLGGGKSAPPPFPNEGGADQPPETPVM